MILDEAEQVETVGSILKTSAFWILAFQMGVGIGTGLTLLNNLAGIVRTLGVQSGGQVGACVSLLSVANAAGRLLFGYASEMISVRGMSRAFILVVVGSLSFIFALLMGTVASASDLILLSFIGGLAFGGHWSVVPAILSDLYVLNISPTIYSIVQLVPALGGYLLSTLVVSSLGYGPESWKWIVILNLVSLSGSWVFLHTCSRIAVAI